jgi:hypothetical protein
MRRIFGGIFLEKTECLDGGEGIFILPSSSGKKDLMETRNQTAI